MLIKLCESVKVSEIRTIKVPPSYRTSNHIFLFKELMVKPKHCLCCDTKEEIRAPELTKLQTCPDRAYI
jgi:hypothetical protein